MSNLKFEHWKDAYEFADKLDAWAAQNNCTPVKEPLDFALRKFVGMSSERLGELILALRKIQKLNTETPVLPLDLAARLPYAIERLQELYSYRR